MRSSSHPKEAGKSDASGRLGFELIAVGASAGGLQSLMLLLTALPVDFGCAVLIATHMSAVHHSYLPELLARKTHLQVQVANDGDLIVHGIAYVAVPDFHLLVENGRIRLSHAASVHHLRPSIDLLFQSVAASYGEHAVAIVLSGSGNDGAEGVRAIKGAGGMVMAEDPILAQFGSMPSAAVGTGCVDMILPAEGLAQALLRVVKRDA